MSSSGLNLEEKIEEAVELLNNPYDNDVSHGGKNGNKGLANVEAYNAVVEKNGEYLIDEKAIENSSKPARIRNIAERMATEETGSRETVAEWIEAARGCLTQHDDNKNLDLDEKEDEYLSKPEIKDERGENLMSEFDNIKQYVQEMDAEARASIDDVEDLAEYILDDLEEATELNELFADETLDTAREVEVTKEGLVNYLEGLDFDGYRAQSDQYAQRSENARDRVF